MGKHGNCEGVLMIDIAKVKYPGMERIMNLRPNPPIALGERIQWTTKLDGSNAGCYLDDNKEMQVRSRNMINAEKKYYTTLKETETWDNLTELITAELEDYNDNLVVFGELRTKGKSPTRLHTYDKSSFVVFDIWSEKYSTFLPYTRTYQLCYHNDLPIVELIGECNCNTLESLYEFRDEMLEATKGEEGTVGKIYQHSKWEKFGLKYPALFFKEKHNLPKIEKVRRKTDEGAVQLPQLPDDEIINCVNEVRNDLTELEFRNVREAMPKIAEYVGLECKKHNCINRQNLFGYYQSKLEDL